MPSFLLAAVEGRYYQEAISARLNGSYDVAQHDKGGGDRVLTGLQDRQTLEAVIEEESHKV